MGPLEAEIRDLIETADRTSPAKLEVAFDPDRTYSEAEVLEAEITHLASHLNKALKGLLLVARRLDQITGE